MTKTRHKPLVFLCLSALHAQSQTDTTSQLLPQINVREYRFDPSGFAAGASDSVLLRGVSSGAATLFSENLLYVRANAPGTLATASARGLGGNRTAVLWNGLNLQNPMNGVVDLSLLPVWPGDRLSVQFGGQSAAQGSGAMGGSVQLKSNLPQHRDGFWADLSAGMGSFSEKNMALRAGFAQKNWASEARFAHFFAENDFKFRNSTLLGAPIVRQSNNHVRRSDVQQFNRIFIGQRSLLETAAWFQQARREIPPAMTEAVSTSWQADRALRMAATLKTTLGQNGLLTTRAGLLDESIFFKLANDVDSSQSRIWLLGGEYSGRVFKKSAFRTGFSGQFQQAKADGYADTSAVFFQNRPLVFASFSFPVKKIRFTALARQECSNDFRVPFTWSVAAETMPGRLVSGRFHVSKNFNVPTFNDRFWAKLGNTQLLPESGISADAGLTFQKITSKTALSGQFTLFSAHVEDLILWLPGTDGQYRPGNQRRVWSRGLESNFAGTTRWRKCKWALAGRWHFTKTSNTRAYDGNANSVDKQLPYVPLHMGSFSVKMERGRLGIAYFQNLTGRRFTLSDNSASVEGFAVASLLADWRILLKNKELRLDFACENLWNRAYQVVAFRAMPGRTFRVCANFKFR